MYAVEFQAPIENGIVHIPKQYQDIQDTKKATFIVMYESVNNTVKKDIIQSQLDEFYKLRDKSNNKIRATMKLVANTDEMLDDGVF
jgi:hypothetical protein